MIYPFNAAEVFKVAINIEKNGQYFYEKAAAMPFSEDVKELFKDLGQQEVGHEKLFVKLLSSLPGEATANTVWDPNNELDQYLKMMADNHVFMQSSGKLDSLLASIKNAADALKMAMDFERDSIIFFLEMSQASDGFESQKQINVLVKEEQKHLKALTLVYDKHK